MGGVTVRPISPPLLVEELADRLAGAHPERRLRVAVDGAPAAAPDRLAAALVEALRVRGRPAYAVAADGFLRAASLRFEHGRTDPDAYYEDWRDDAGLRRELLDPAGPGGTGRVLPSLWDPATDRATRAPYQSLAPTAVVLLHGALLLGVALPFDVTVHLDLSDGALARRTPQELSWTLPAFRRYAQEVDPAAVADVVVRADDPRRPAVVDPS
jgi:hypothetical protein